ncbi:hypothetical protein PCASD_18822 [Puccinia coronata f. sp. avenae]|uniref:Uncharacterized protein n=1 Tax=Puccinia coronata f. sp. avenae TaxID=200324 RepID=A0A2N5TP70_9BASI|nr:hypothetical protein PCASD_18822 [Puccinia coronata f. sp. avenae]
MAAGLIGYITLAVALPGHPAPPRAVHAHSEVFRLKVKLWNVTSKIWTVSSEKQLAKMWKPGGFRRASCVLDVWVESPTEKAYLQALMVIIIRCEPLCLNTSTGSLSLATSLQVAAHRAKQDPTTLDATAALEPSRTQLAQHSTFSVSTGSTPLDIGARTSFSSNRRLFLNPKPFIEPEDEIHDCLNGNCATRG